MNDSERLTIAQALYKKLAKLVSTKDPDSLRTACDRELMQMFEDNGIDRVRLRANGVMVGNMSIRETKGKPQISFVVDDDEVFRDWCEQNGYMRPDYDAIHADMAATGVVPDGCTVETYVPEPTFSTVLKIDEDAVLAAYGDKLVEPVKALLEGE